MADGDGWVKLGSVTEYECPWFDAGYDRVRRPDGEVVRYYWVEAPDAVAVVPVTDDGDLVVVEEYRPNLQGPVLSLPAGRRDPGEAWTDAAGRELREETGFVAADLQCLETIAPTTRLRQAFGVIAATDLAPGDQDLDDGEYIDVDVLEPAEALAGMRDGPTVGWAVAALEVARAERVL